MEPSVQWLLYSVHSNKTLQANLGKSTTLGHMVVALRTPKPGVWSQFRQLSKQRMRMNWNTVLLCVKAEMHRRYSILGALQCSDDLVRNAEAARQGSHPPRGML